MAVGTDHGFVIRVGANVTRLRKYGSVRAGDGGVSCWPDAAARRGQPPLVLRRLHRREGRRSMWRATDVSDARELSDAEAVGQNKLRSRTPDRAVELD